MIQFAIPALIALSSTSALAAQPAAQPVEILASCQSPRYVVVVAKSQRGTFATVRTPSQTSSEPNLMSIAVDPARDAQYAVVFADRANLPSEFKLGITAAGSGQSVQATLERAILDDGTVVSGEAMICTIPQTR